MIGRSRRSLLTRLVLGVALATSGAGAGAQEELFDEPVVTAAVQVTGNGDAARAQ